MRFCLNVQALVGSITGIERYTYEVLSALDACLSTGSHAGIEVEAIYPQGMQPNLPSLSTIAPVEVNGWKGGKDYLALRRYLKKRDAYYVNFSGGLAVQRKSIVVFYDLRPHTHPEYDLRSTRARFGLSLATTRALGCNVVTISEFSRKELLEAGIDDKRITLASCGWEHMRDVKSDASVFGEHPELVADEYYYVLGSLAPHKNLDWVIGVARANPRCTIALAGKLWEGNGAPQDLPPNVRYLGYVSDEQSRALMGSCKAFLHPATYEGFGLPPLEAIVCGKRVLAARGTAVEGVYGDALRYFDAHDYAVDLDSLANFEPSAAAYADLLARYTWRASATAWLTLMAYLSQV